MKKIIFIVSLICFIIPFFWFKSGEVNLGGDSSRLYFYDPLAYLKNDALYNIPPSETGQEASPYFFAPFVLLLAAMKVIVFNSPHLLIVIFYSIMVTVGFTSVALIIYEFLTNGTKEKKISLWVVLSSIIGGLLYILTPVVGYNWDKNLISHNQVFLNPLIFYLLLRFVNSRKIKYALIAIFVSFLFAPNFSFTSAPPFFAFYPITIAYLIIYSKFIKKKYPSVKIISFLVVLMISLHAFHLFPLVKEVFDKNTNVSQRIFSENWIADAQSYFDGSRLSVKLSNNIGTIPQGDGKPLFIFDFLLYSIPAILLMGLILNIKKRNNDIQQRLNYLLLISFFLLAMFFDTANITPLSINIYRFLFNFPGFGMFRNYFGQFMYLFFFFYAIVFGVSLYQVACFLKQKQNYLLFSFFAVLMLVNGWPFINGTLVNQPFYQGRVGIKGTFKMDKTFEKVLDYFRGGQDDGKVLTFPFTDYGSQVVAGDGGFYMGPSMIGYLTGRKDFTLYTSFLTLADQLKNATMARHYEEINKILSLFNIRYIFHNQDPEIYSMDNFPGFPYALIRFYFPKDQKEYLDFIKKLGSSLIKQIGDKFSIYKTNDKYYLPHIYPSAGITLTNLQDQILLQSFDQESSNILPANYWVEKFSKMDLSSFNRYFVDITNKSPFLDLLKSRRVSRYGVPYVSQPVTSLFYPLVVAREDADLKNSEKKNDAYFDLAVFLADKRIQELLTWGDYFTFYGDISNIRDLDKEWLNNNQESSSKAFDYNKWETAFWRYRQTMLNLSSKINNFNNSRYPLITNKMALRQALTTQKMRLDRVIVESHMTDAKQKEYLLNLSALMFEEIYNSIAIGWPDSSKINYSVKIPESGKYEVYVEKGPLKNYDPSMFGITLNDHKLQINQEQNRSDWVRYDDMTFSNVSKVNAELKILQSADLASGSEWTNAKKVNIGTTSASLTIDNSTLEAETGLLKKIENWASGSFYIISFDYLTYGKKFNVRLFEQQGSAPEQTNKIFEDVIQTKKWMHYKQLIVPTTTTYPHFIQIVPGDNSFVSAEALATPSARIDINNFSLIQIPHPKIIVIKKKNMIEDTKENVPPNITFSRINPTKYQVKITGAKNPYSLIFLDAFNPKWKLYLKDNGDNEPGIKAFILRILSFFGTRLSRLFTQNNDEIKNTTVQYFNGKVSEGDHKNIFLEPDTFETWGKKMIADDRHMIINGYSNGWYIKPADAGNRSDYELILEISSQKVFYIGIAISLATMVIMVLWLIKENRLNAKNSSKN